MATISTTLGIDFGTLELLPRAMRIGRRAAPDHNVEAGQNTLPTALFFDNEEKRIIYGRGAQIRRLIRPARTGGICGALQKVCWGRP